VNGDPADAEVAAALCTVLIGGAAASSAQRVNVHAVSGSSRPVYHVIVGHHLVAGASGLLSTLLKRPFSSEQSGWFIDAAEARALLKVARR
jgi:hypothetical protein